MFLFAHQYVHVLCVCVCLSVCVCMHMCVFMYVKPYFKEFIETASNFLRYTYIPLSSEVVI